jgi:hypothetical protein
VHRTEIDGIAAYLQVSLRIARMQYKLRRGVTQLCLDDVPANPHKAAVLVYKRACRKKISARSRASDLKAQLLKNSKSRVEDPFDLFG